LPRMDPSLLPGCPHERTATTHGDDKQKAIVREMQLRSTASIK